MTITRLRNFALTLGLGTALASVLLYAAAPEKPAPAQVQGAGRYFKPDDIATDGSVGTASGRVNYTAHAGTLVVHAKNWDDVAVPANAEKEDKEAAAQNPGAEASMFYAAYFKKGVGEGQRPIMFLFNGGPGSATVWLHMGAFGPRRVVTSDDAHTPAAPYRVVDNQWSLLDAADLVFIDAPGAGFSRIAGKDKEKAFWGIDEDAHAFSEFINQFLTKYSRWNSPKYIFGESYGTTRAAVLSNMLQSNYAIDLNGVIMLSQILNFDMSADGPQVNPGVNLPYQLALPTYAASAWYHNKLPGQKPADLRTFLGEVQHFAMGDYAQALQAGSALNDQQRNMIAQRLHNYTGLRTDYILRADLRIDGGMFEQNLQDAAELTTGRLDTRFSGPSLDPLDKEADYDPQSASISSAYISAFNDYARDGLKYGEGRKYYLFAPIKEWDFKHQQPGSGEALQTSPNVMPDLAVAMKTNPNLRVMLNAGFYDLATPYYEGIYEMRQLPIPRALQSHIEYKQYESGHMVYAHEQSLKEIHDAVADFVRRTDNVGR
ncbi:MAG: peptidase S10 [Alphaproteobacteria bacterium]|nr:peptidase S10 [Alphaproteobacteria bacterium]